MSPGGSGVAAAPNVHPGRVAGVVLGMLCVPLVIVIASREWSTAPWLIPIGVSLAAAVISLVAPVHRSFWRAFALATALTLATLFCAVLVLVMIIDPM